MADLRINRAAVCTVHGLRITEAAPPVMRLRVHEGGVGQDWTGWTVDYAKIATPDQRTVLVDLSVNLEADGWVEIQPSLAQLAEALSPSIIHPHGMRAKMTVRLKDPSTWPVYLIAPSDITIAQGPGATT